MDSRKAPFLFRLWYYIRVGFGEYLNFTLSILNTIILVYAFVVSNASDMPSFFASFRNFLILGILTVVPGAILLGWLHFKRIPAFKAEADLMVEANPYYYKFAPGWQTKVQLPWLKFMAKSYVALLTKNGALQEDERKALNELIGNLELLEQGGTLQ